MPGQVLLLLYATKASAQAARQKADELAVEVGAEQSPEEAMHDPGPPAEGKLLARENVAAPPKLLTEDVNRT